MNTISANVLVRNEYHQVDSFVRNMIDANIDEIIFLDGGSTDGTYERLLYWETIYPCIHVLLWKQPLGSAYRIGFKESIRRNLMIDASSMNWCLYIDIDERISSSFKEQVFLQVNHSLKQIRAIALPRVQFWNGYVRVDLADDKVWYPNLGFKLFKRNSALRFNSSDVNGLHNFLTYRNKKAFGGFNKNRFVALGCRLYNNLIGFVYTTSLASPIYHLHYWGGNHKKENDLRANEFDFKIELVSSISKGQNYSLKDKVIPCCHLPLFPGAQEIIDKYIE